MNPKAKAAMDKVIARFQSGDLAPIVEVARIALPDDAPAAAWTYNNRVLAYAQSGSLDCRGYRQWGCAGRQVRKGENSGYIFGPRFRKEKDENGDEHPRLSGFKAIPVFGYHQTDELTQEMIDAAMSRWKKHGGIKPDHLKLSVDGAFSYEPKEPPPLLDLAEKLGLDVTWGPLANAYGSFSKKGKRIAMGANDAQVLFHEIAHAVHSRIQDDWVGGQDAKQETVADLTGAILSQMYGYDYTGNTWAYIERYNPDNPMKAIYSALETVGKVLEFIDDLQEAA